MPEPRGPSRLGPSTRRTRLLRLVPIVLGAAAIALLSLTWSPGGTVPDMSTSELARLAKQGEIASITQTDDGLAVVRTNPPGTARVRTDPRTDVYALLAANGVPPARVDAMTIAYAPPSGTGWSRLILMALPLLAVPLLLLWFMRRGANASGSALEFGRTRARRVVGAKTTTRFADVAGVEEAKEELREVVEFLTTPESFTALGARTPRGVLLVGPPGTGKTLLARAVAGEAGVPFFSVSGSEFVEMFVGVGASRTRDLFNQAKKQAPCIVFVDEVDAIGRSRGVGVGGGNDEREQTLNQILVEMDGFDTNTNVIVLAATNRPDVLDPALLRPGRFDRQVTLDRPDAVGRAAILTVHAQGKPFDREVDLSILARQTPGFTGADLANVLNEAAILAARRDRKTIGNGELEEAVDRVISGPARTSRVIARRDREIVAYHEAGHAVVARYMPNLDPLHKVTILARGTAGGYTRLLPTEDRYYHSRAELEATLVFTLGGRVAEEIVFAEASTGASNDIEQATNLARYMVSALGMSARLGTVALGKRSGSRFLGRGVVDPMPHSHMTTQLIDEEIRALIDAGADRAREILRAHADGLERLARSLLERETLAGEELDRVLLGTS